MHARAAQLRRPAGRVGEQPCLARAHPDHLDDVALADIAHEPDRVGDDVPPRELAEAGEQAVARRRRRP
jgi:hypothetical protein